MSDGTTLSPNDFGEFFAAVNDGCHPFAWQQRLVDYVVDHGKWPEQIVAPTGSGKSAVVEVHVFLNALCAAQNGPRVPRRLFTVVNRRALVDNQHDRARRISAVLQDAANEPTPSLLRTMAQALSSLHTAAPEDVSGTVPPVTVGLLRGGAPRNNPTLLDPSACAVVSATPDMWGSRLLFRGYGASRRARPREAAVTAYDSVVVLDESHLNRQLLVTARQIARLVHREEELGIPRLQVVETTATPAEDNGSRVGVEADDLLGDPVLEARLRASKPLALHVSDNWVKQASGRRSNRQYLSELADAVIESVEVARSVPTDGARTVGCIVNRVNTAVDLADILSRKAPDLSAEILVGRMRPADLTVRRSKYPGLFTVSGDARVDVLIATQTLEVGIDIDLAALVTELASASALTQRFGRVNRLGRRPQAPVTVMVPETAPSKDCLPYTRPDLESGLTWLQSIADSSADVSPVSLGSLPLPEPTRRRTLYQRPEWSDVNQWSRTGDRLFADDDLDLWLRDDLEPDAAQAGIVVRGGLPVDDLAAVEFLRAAPPRSEEEFPAGIGVVRDLVDHLFEGKAGGELPHRAFLVRDNNVILIDPESDRTMDPNGEGRIRPADTVVVDYGARFTTQRVATYVEDARTVPKAVEDPSVLVFAEPGFCRGKGTPDRRDLRREFAGLTVDEATELWKETYGGSDHDTVILPTALPEDTDEVPWFMVRTEEPADDALVRQQWTPSRRPVLLADHNADVARRARTLAERVGLVPELIRTVVAAGLHHDDGKADVRFQKLLGNSDPDHMPLRAKSGGNDRRQNRRASEGAGLPVGWRHEQYSVVLTELARRHGDGSVDDLVIRLVGTSHGHGRNGFPHVGGELLGPLPHEEEATVAEELFTTGRWDELVENTATSTGHYAVSYLEALVRAADNQISKEGH